MAKRWAPVLEYVKPDLPHRRAVALPAIGAVLLLSLGVVTIRMMAASRSESSGRSPKSDLANIAVALDQFEVDCGRYPSTAEGLDALVNAPAGVGNWRGPYVKRTPRDPWGNEYVYRCPSPSGSSDYQLLSKGPDGEEGTADDIIGSP
jgi:general secretion pathway protein G